jgi:hypothetical protein
MSQDSEPLAVIKVTFDDLPDEFKNKLYIFLGAGLACLVLVNILLSIRILDTFYNKIKYLIDKDDRNYYQPV